MEFPKPTEVLGRIAAQTAKQVIFQKVREAERENIFAEYNQRIGEVVNGTVKRFENGDIIIEIGRIEAVLPRKEQSRAESYTPADRVRTVIKGVNRSAKGPQIVLSRTDPALLIKLFEQEVPEIYDGTVMIRGAVREAGDRAKVAVFSRERDVDPVGACVGMKGTRVQSIIRELRGEKIDIVEWSEDPIAFVTNALSPAKVQRVSIVDDRERVMEVVVEDKQLSLAIGKKGQNVRLAAKLTGWRIDIKSEEEKRREVEAQFEGLEAAAMKSARRPMRPTRPRTAPAKARAGTSADARQTAKRRCPTRSRASARRRSASWSTAGLDDARGGRRTRRSSSCRRFPGIGEKTAEKILAAARGEAPAPTSAARRTNTAGVSSLATVRIYKVAELLGTTSQEVTALLKRDHGIEVKSASSTIEEVVGAPVRRAPRDAAQHHAADRRHLRRDAGRQGQEAGAGEEGAGAGEAGGAGAAAAAARQDGEAGRRAAVEAEAIAERRAGGSAGRRSRPAPEPAPVEEAADATARVEAPAANRSSKRRRRRIEVADRRCAARSEAAAPAAEAGAGPRRAADAAAAHRRTAADDADAAAADGARAADRAAAENRPAGMPAAARPAAGGAPGKPARPASARRGSRWRRGPARRPGASRRRAAAASGVSGRAAAGARRRTASAAVAAGSHAAARACRRGRASISIRSGRACRSGRRCGRAARAGPRRPAPRSASRRRRRCRRRRRRSRARSRSPKA